MRPLVDGIVTIAAYTEFPVGQLRNRPPFVQRLAGHSSLATMNIYTHLEGQSLISAISSFLLFNELGIVLAGLLAAGGFRG